MEEKGFFPISRKIVDHWTWKDPITRSAWEWLLLMAAFSPHDGLKRGQVYFSIYDGKEFWGMTVPQTRRFLKKLSTPGPWNDYKPEITWERGRGICATCDISTRESTRSDTPKNTHESTRSDTRKGIITLLEYNTYNPSQKGSSTHESTRSDTLKNTRSDSVENTLPPYSLDVIKVLRNKEKNPAQKKPPTPKPKSDHREVIDYFCSIYELILDDPYVFQGGRDGSAVKRIIKIFPVDEIKIRIGRYLNDTDEFVTKQGHSLSFFCSRINTYGNAHTDNGNRPQPQKRRRLTEDELRRLSNPIRTT